MTHSCGTSRFSRHRLQIRYEPKQPTHEEIAKLAYSYWEARGCQHGLALEDWLRAERELSQRYWS